MKLILHVEDEVAHALLVKLALERLAIPFEVKHLLDGEAALDYLFRQGVYSNPASSPRPALVLLDLNIPRIDGFQILKKLKGDELLQDIPVVILTSSSSRNDELRAMDSHADGYLTKPGTFTDLLEKLKRLAETYLAETPS